MRKMVLVSIGLSLLSAVVCAQNFEMPKRKAGQWETKFESAMAGRVTTMEQCIDEKTDAELQKRSLQGNGKSECRLISSKKTLRGWEVDSVCQQGQTTIKGHTVMVGDFSSAYQMDSITTFSPPVQGMSEMKSTMKVRYLGACKPDMRPGDMSMNGVKMGGVGYPGQAPRMTPEQMKKMMEAMQKGKPE